MSHKKTKKKLKLQVAKWLFTKSQPVKMMTKWYHCRNSNFRLGQSHRKQIMEKTRICYGASLGVVIKWSSLSEQKGLKQMLGLQFVWV